MQNWDWKSILAQLQLCQWPGFKHICSCDESKHAKYRGSNLNIWIHWISLWHRLAWWMLDGPLCANVFDNCHMLHDTAVAVDDNWPRTWQYSWILWAPRRTHENCNWNMLVTCCLIPAWGHIPDRRSHAPRGHLIAKQFRWVKSRPGGILDAF